MTAFAPRFVYGDLDLTDHPFMVELGADLGNAQTVTAVVDSLLTDGELLSGERESNREIVLSVVVEGTDLAAVADAEALLVGEVRKQRNTLVVYPGDDMGPSSTFDTFRAQVEWQRDDDLERAGLRRFVLTIPALPFTSSFDTIVDDADTPPSDGGTLLNNCESTTGWSQAESPFGSGSIGTGYAVDTVVFTEGAGSIRSRPWYGYRYYWVADPYYTYGFHDRVTGLSLDTGTGGYLAISIKASHGDPAFTGDTSSATGMYMTTVERGEEVVNFITTGRDDDGFIRYVWPVDADLTVTGFRFYWFLRRPDTASGLPYGYYDDIRLLESATTDKTIVKQLTVKGSARTTGSLLVASPADEVALGRVLAVTVPTDAIPAGYTPDTRRWVTQGTTAADSDAPSESYFSSVGSYSSAAGNPIFDAPAALYTAGAYVAVLCGEPQTSTPFAGVRAQLLIDGTAVGELSTAEEQFGSVDTGAYGFFPVGTLFLPPTPVLSPDGDTKVRFLFSANNFRLDNLYLIPAWQVGGRPVADFSIVDCGSGVVGPGGSSSHLWIDSPSTSQPQGGYWRGPDATKQLARSAWADAAKPGLHVFEPGSLTAFVASTDAQGPRVELTYRPAWYGSAAI